MSISVFDIFTIGIGPSSSHTVGPMRAARRFAERASGTRPGEGEGGVAASIGRIAVELYGSLGHTGRAHGTDAAVMLGLEGETPEGVDPDTVPARLNRIRSGLTIALHGNGPVHFDPDRDLVFNRRETLPFHSNGMRFQAFDPTGGEIEARTYYSVGGGFVVTDGDAALDRLDVDATALAFPFRSGDELLEIGRTRHLSISEIMLQNETAWRTDSEIRGGLLDIWRVMQESVERGCNRDDPLLPGTLAVPRRAPALFKKLQAGSDVPDPLAAIDWVNLYALAVNEENASGGRVVTAPTNGAAGIIPAVLHYYQRFCPGFSEEGVVRFLLTAGAIGILYKENASISGAEVGCQGEVGVACSMAAGGLTEALGGTIDQVEQAAEIGMEHNLGLTCDPVGGYVQIPCIERNAMGAVKAINASRMALKSDGKHRVSLDKVIKTMRQTGRDMKTKYKESSRGGLAVNVIEC